MAAKKASKKVAKQVAKVDFKFDYKFAGKIAAGASAIKQAGEDKKAGQTAELVGVGQAVVQYRNSGIYKEKVSGNKALRSRVVEKLIEAGLSKSRAGKMSSLFQQAAGYKASESATLKGSDDPAEGQRHRALIVGYMTELNGKKEWTQPNFARTLGHFQIKSVNALMNFLSDAEHVVYEEKVAKEVAGWEVNHGKDFDVDKFSDLLDAARIEKAEGQAERDSIAA